MYLPGPDIRPTGCEPAEFIEVTTFAPMAEPAPATPEAGDENEPGVE
jgi:hypothetical protein